jgi:hypothetical protein
MGVFEELLKTSLIDVGEVKIARATTRLHGIEGKARYLVYLPTSRAYLWKALHETGERVRIFIEIPERVRAKLGKSPQ